MEGHLTLERKQHHWLRFVFQWIFIQGYFPVMPGARGHQISGESLSHWYEKTDEVLTMLQSRETKEKP